eukprot:3038985-Amphidinium_carterae.1
MMSSGFRKMTSGSLPSSVESTNSIAFIIKAMLTSCPGDDVHSNGPQNSCFPPLRPSFQVSLDLLAMHASPTSNCLCYWLKKLTSASPFPSPSAAPSPFYAAPRWHISLMLRWLTPILPILGSGVILHGLHVVV